MGNTKWEYSVASVNEMFSDEQYQVWLDEKGEEGWELVNVTESTWHTEFSTEFMVDPNVNVTFYFKRPK